VHNIKFAHYQLYVIDKSVEIMYDIREQEIKGGECLSKPLLGVIGAGHMGSALLTAILDAAVYSPGEVWVSCLDDVQLEPFAVMGCHVGKDNRAVLESAELIVLAVRPCDMSSVLKEAAPSSKGKCFLSLAAGVSIQAIGSVLPPGVPIMRAMPNTALIVGKGTTALAFPGGVPERYVNAAREIFESAGIMEVVEEGLMSVATSINGSGPGYFFRIASVMAGFAREQGMDYPTALRLAAGTMQGAAEVLLKGECSPEDLAKRVAVPGGTTQAAFLTMDRLGFDHALRHAMLDCAARADELGNSPVL